MERMIEKEEKERYEKEQRYLMTVIKKEKKKRDCLDKALKEREKEDERNRKAKEAENTINAIEWRRKGHARGFVWPPPYGRGQPWRPRRG